MIDDPAIQSLLRKRLLDKSMGQLTGIITGMVVDDNLHDLEIHYLKSWLTEHAEATTIWPGTAVAKLLQHILADGVITQSERDHLLGNLKALVGTDFAQTGSTTSEVIALPVDEDCPVSLRDANICLTGEFLFGTRPKCEQLASQCGATPMSSVSRKIAYLIIGTNVSQHWAHTSYGRKIEQAMLLQQAGHPIKIITERRWIHTLI